MYLTAKEERALSGEFGEPLRIAYQVLVAIGRVSNAEKLIPIKWVHVSGVSHLTIGDFGLEFLKKLSGSNNANFKVFTTINPCGMDIEKWGSLKISPEYAQKQLEIISSYERLGIANSFTCIPFQSYPPPRKGTHVAWGESSAAIYANSVLGLKTNRESAVSALAAGLAGKTVYSDLHIERNRRPEKNIKVSFSNGKKLRGSLDFGILGYFAGKNVLGVIGFQRVRSSRIEETKALCASIGTSGSSGMFVFDSKERTETLDFGENEYEEIFGELSDSDTGDAVVFGCPQMTIEELYQLSKELYGKKLKKKCVVFCSSKIYDLAKSRGYTQTIESAGAIFIRDACADFTPVIPSLHVESVITDSCKGAYYMKRVHGVKVALKETNAIIKEEAE